MLFPFPNRIRDGSFTFQGKQYSVNPPRHGFVRDKPWRLLATGASDNEGAWVRSAFDAAEHPQEILAQFPFPFQVEAVPRLRNARLELSVTARNTGTTDMPAGFGIHPYFRLPRSAAVQVPAGKRWELADRLPNGTLVDLEAQYNLRQPRSTTGLVLDDIFTDLIADADGVVRCRLIDLGSQVETGVESNIAQFRHVVVYTPPPQRQAICIEPNSCPTDAFNLQARGMDSDMITLKPGEAASFEVVILSRAASELLVDLGR